MALREVLAVRFAFHRKAILTDLEYFSCLPLKICTSRNVFSFFWNPLDEIYLPRWFPSLQKQCSDWFYLEISNVVFFVNVKLIDVTVFMGIHLDVSYDNSFMQLQNYALESDSTDFLLQSAGQLINFINNNIDDGHFQLDLGVAGGSVTGVSGTGNIVRLIFEHIGPRGQSVISISSESTVRDVYNNSVVEHIFSGVVSIW